MLVAERPLSSQEITTLLLSMFTAVPDATPAELQVALDRAATQLPWQAAVSATVTGLLGWCSPADVEAAVVIVATRAHQVHPEQVVS